MPADFRLTSRSFIERPYRSEWIVGYSDNKLVEWKVRLNPNLIVDSLLENKTSSVVH